MSTKSSTMKSVAVAIALMAGVSGGALAGRHSERSENEALQKYLHDAWASTPDKSANADRSAPSENPALKGSSKNADPAPVGGAEKQLQQGSSTH